MPKAFERCVAKTRGRVRNPFAVCTASDAGRIKAYRRKEARVRQARRKA